MKILHVLQSSHFSGAENVVCQIIKMFENNDDIEMAYTSKDGTIRKALEDRNIRFFPMKTLCHDEFKPIVAEYKPDIIHGHDIRGAIEASRFSHQAKVIHTIHGNDIRMRKLSAKSFLYLVSALKAKHIFWVSKSCLKQYKFHCAVKSKSSILYNVVDPNAVIQKSKLDLNSYNYDVIYIGRIAYPKNPQRLMKVLSIIANSRPQFRAAIIGKGELEEITKKLAEEYRITENVDFLGFMSNPYKVLSDSKIMLMTSDWEGTPMVALEALALGKPIVSTPTDGISDIIQNGINGFCENDEALLAKRIIDLLTDNKLYGLLSEAQLEKNKEVNNVHFYKKQIEKAYGIK